MTGHVLSGLTKRRAELTGEAETLRARLAQIGTDVVHLDVVIRQFDPDYDLGSIRPKRARPEDAVGRGEIGRFVLQVLREATEPVATHDVARRLMAERGQDVEDRRLMKLTMKRVKNSGRFSTCIREQGVARTRSPGSLSRGPQPA
jgi:hypothetical protein